MLTEETPLLASPQRSVNDAHERVSSPSPSPSSPSSAARFLYASYWFAAWGDRMWEFAAIIFVLELFPGTLLSSSLLGFVETAAGIASSAAIGAYIDRTNRLQVVRLSVAAQNVSIAIAGAVFYVALLHTETWSRHTMWAVFAVLCACACVARWASSMNKIALHKDWLVVLAHGQSKLQTQLNANMRRVDLLCSILAPLAVGVLSSLTTSALACVAISAWSSASFFVEWVINGWVYANVPALHVKAAVDVPDAVDAVDATVSHYAPVDPIDADVEGHAAAPTHPHPPPPPHARSTSSAGTFHAYVHHPVFLASLGYCLLYVSCLSFGGIMVAYLKTLGLSDAWLAGGRAIAAVVGVFATAMTPIMVSRLGLLRSGMLAVWLQLSCLVPLVIGFLLLDQHSLLFIVLVFVTICSSRFGLWSFDLVETQVMQEMVRAADAGRINGAQEALLNVGYLLSFVLTMVFSDPTQFVYPAIMSVSAVALCALCFSSFVRCQRV